MKPRLYNDHDKVTLGTSMKLHPLSDFKGMGQASSKDSPVLLLAHLTHPPQIALITRHKVIGKLGFGRIVLTGIE